MSNIKDWLDANGKTLDCAALKGLSTAAMLRMITSDYSLFPEGTESIFWYLAKEAIDNTYRFYGCEGEPDTPDDPKWGITPLECQKVLRPGAIRASVINRYGSKYWYDITEEGTALEILDFGQGPSQSIRVVYLDENGRSAVAYGPDDAEYGIVTAWIVPPKNCYCVEQPPVYPPQPPTPPGPPQTHEDEDCKWTFTPVDTHVDDGGIAWTKYNAQVDPSTCGEEFFFWTSQGGNKYCVPLDYECPPPGTTSGGGGDCNPELTGTTYYLWGDCDDPEDWDMEEGEEVVFEWKIEDQNALQGIARRLDAIAEMIDYSGALRTPICNEKPEQEGDWVTANWISDESSSDSRFRLRKRTRYRSKSGRSDAELAEYFSGFTWKAGPVCVRHTGAWWGEPQVWAESINEGKRVIRFIAAEADIDPDSVGKWAASGARNPRFGRTGTMRLRTIEGFPWVSSRDGSNMLPMG